MTTQQLRNRGAAILRPIDNRRQAADTAPWHPRIARLAGAALALLLLLLAAPVLRAQVSSASIRGTVRDQQGAVVAGALLRLVNVDTQVGATKTANESGDYLYLNLTPGTYTLEASAPGFNTQKLSSFVLQVNQATTLDFTLAVGAVSQVVSVQAIGEGLQASSSEVSTTLESKQVGDLPLNSRNFTSLFVTNPGVSPITPSGSQVASYTTSIGPISIPSFNGQTNRSDLFYLDGVLDIETFGNAYAVQPVLDTIQDIKLQSHNDSAEFGGSTGGTINIATKAGTNQLHGAGWEFNKTSSLQALPYFTAPGTPLTPLSQNQYGGAVGGPVIIPKLYNGRNKTFFYFAYEGFRFSSPSEEYLIVPTAAQYAGDFSTSLPIYDPASTTCDASGNCTRKQFPGNQIPAADLNAGDIYYAQHVLPAATITGNPQGNAITSYVNTQNMSSYNGRMDETINSKDSVFFRISTEAGSNLSGRSQIPTSINTNGRQYVGSWAHIFGADSVLHIEAGKTYLSRPSLARFKGVSSDFDTQVGYPTAITSGYPTLKTLIPGFSVANYFSDTGENGGPQTTADGWSLKGDYTLLKGKHTLKMGAEFNKIGEGQDIEYSNYNMTANETSNIVSPGTTGDALASFMIGIPNQITKRSLVESLGFGGVFGTYFQDQFQVSPKLTLNAGLRYDLTLIPKYGTPGDGNQYVGNFDFNNGTYVVYKVPGSCASLGNAPCIPTPDGSLPDHVVASSDGKVMENTPLNLQPRLGAAYRITPTTVIRAGFGIAFDNYAAMVQNDRGVSGNWPSVGQIQKENINNPTSADPFPGYTTQNLPGLQALPAPTPFALENWYVDPKIKNAYSMQWNFGAQRQLNSATVVSATYVGSANRRLNVGGFYNVATVPGPGDPSLRYPYPYISPTFYSRSNGAGNYNALELQLNRRFTQGLALTAAYTWSKSIDEGCSGFFGSEGCNVQQIYKLSAERSVSAFDVPQNLAVSWIYALPIGTGKLLDTGHPALNYILGNWQWNGITQFHSGTPYSINIPGDPANIGGNGYERPNLVGNPNPSNRSPLAWLNPAAFAEPAQYTYGDMGRNALRTQFSNNLDTSLFREFPFAERYTVQIRGEAFNLFNTHVFGQPSSTLGASNFGTITSTNNSPRSIQLGAKFVF